MFFSLGVLAEGVRMGLPRGQYAVVFWFCMLRQSAFAGLIHGTEGCLYVH